MPLHGVSAERWLHDGAEALSVGSRLGDKLVVIGTSTGASLLLALADHPDFARIDTLVLMSDGAVAAVGPVDELMNRLDLRPLTGRYEAGAVLTATVSEHDRAHRLTGLSFPGGTLLVPALEAAIGTRIRLRIRARDVSLALEPPKDISILNVFAGEVREIGPVTGALVDVLVDAGAPIWARITARSVAQLGLKPGHKVHALVKAVAIDRHSVGGVRDRPLHGDIG